MWWAKCHSLISGFHYLLKKKKIALYKNFKFIIKSIEANQKSTEKKVKMMTSIPSSQNNHRTWLSLPHDWGPLISNKKRQLRLGFFFFNLFLFGGYFTILHWLLPYNSLNQPQVPSLPNLAPTPNPIPPLWLSQSTGLGSLCYKAASLWLSVLHVVVYMVQIHSQVFPLCLHLYFCSANRFLSTIS